MHKNIEFEVHLTSHSFRLVPGHKCTKRNVYSENISKLPNSREKSKHSIELRKQYEKINENFKRKRTEYITQESIKEVINDIESCMTPNAGGEPINEYGHYRLELEEIEITSNKYGPEVYHHGRMGDYGWSSTIRLHKKCDIIKLRNELENKYRNVKIKG